MKRRALGVTLVSGLLLFPPSAQAAVSFVAPVLHATGAAPTGLALGDFDKDGDVDLATANSGTTTTTILDGGTGSATSHAAGGAPRSVAAGDFDGDGNLDLALTLPALNQLTVLWGSGAGQPDGFDGTSSTFAAGTSPVDVAAGDLNGDARADLVVANSTVDQVGVMLAGAGRTFGAWTPIAGGMIPSAVVVADFNGNGALDAAATSQGGGGGLRVYRGDGSGAIVSNGTHPTVAAPRDLATGDFNQDGRPDLVMPSAGANAVSVFLNQGTFAFQRADYSVAAGSGPTGVVTGDFTGDGRDDVATLDTTSGNVTVLPSNSDGTLGAGTSYPAGAGAARAVAADFDGDGLLDLAVTTSASSVAILGGHAAPALAVTAHDGVAGAPLSDSAVLSGAAPHAGGTVDFTAFAPGDATCAGAPVYTASVNVSGNGTYAPPGFAPAHAGVYRWTASYSGDATTGAAGSACDHASTVAKATPAVFGTATGGAAGRAIGDRAELTGGHAPGGTLTFRAWPTANCTGAPVFMIAVPVTGTGTYEARFTPAAAGTYSWRSSYGGDADNEPADTACHTALVGLPHVRLSRVSATRCAGRAATIRFALSDAATVKLTLRRKVKPMAWRRCPGKLPGTRKASRYRTVSSRTVSAAHGANRFKLDTARLKPGRYHVVISATTVAGAKVTATVGFWVVAVAGRR